MKNELSESIFRRMCAEITHIPTEKKVIRIYCSKVCKSYVVV